MEEILLEIQKELLKYEHFVNIDDLRVFCKTEEKAKEDLKDLQVHKHNAIIVKCCKYV